MEPTTTPTSLGGMHGNRRTDAAILDLFLFEIQQRDTLRRPLESFGEEVELRQWMSSPLGPSRTGPPRTGINPKVLYLTIGLLTMRLFVSGNKLSLGYSFVSIFSFLARPLRQYRHKMQVSMSRNRRYMGCSGCKACRCTTSQGLFNHSRPRGVIVMCHRSSYVTVRPPHHHPARYEEDM